MKHAYCLWPLRNPCDKNLQQLRGTVFLYSTEREKEIETCTKKKYTETKENEPLKKNKI